MIAATRTLPAHGTLACRKQYRCSHPACVKVARDYDNNRSRQIAYGRWQPLVDVKPVLEHIAQLSDCGIGWMRTADLAGLSHGIVSAWLYGKGDRPAPRRVKALNAAKVLAVRPTLDNVADHAVIDAVGTRRRLQGLVVAGYPQSDLAWRLGMKATNFTRLIHGDLVRASTARAARALFAELLLHAPETRGVSRVSAERARNLGRRKGWAPVGAWDAIDDPDAVPDLGASADQVMALVENAEFIHDTDKATWQHTAERLGVGVEILHKYRSRVRERAAAGGAA